MTVKETNQMHRHVNRMSEVVGTLLVDGFHALALFAIARRPSGRRCTRSWAWRRMAAPILTISGAMLLLAHATLAVRCGSARYPSASASTSP